MPFDSVMDLLMALANLFRILFYCALCNRSNFGVISKLLILALYVIAQMVKCFFWVQMVWVQITAVRVEFTSVELLKQIVIQAFWYEKSLT